MSEAGPAADSAAGRASELARLEGITKRFPGVLALDGVDFDLRRGEVHVLFGENGAGKSTLINVIAGTYPPDGGRYVYQGQELRGLNPHRARQLGISPVFQEFSLAPDLTIEENLFLGHEEASLGFLKKGPMREQAARLLGELGFALNPRARIRDLSRAHQQMVEIAKALLHKVQLLILDEPTASLTESETVKLFALVARLKAQGAGIIYVSHRMAEIHQLADRITVLRDGRKIGTVGAHEVSEGRLVEMMTGRKIEVLFPRVNHRPAGVALEAKGLSLAGGTVDDVSLTVRKGEIVGVAGLVGCGKSELARAIFGLETITGGSIRIGGETADRLTPRTALQRRVCYFPSDRVAEGLALVRPIRENASMAALDLPAFQRTGMLRRGAEKSTIQSIVDRLRLRPPQIEREVGNLSGGNRQKVMLARGLTRDTEIFLFDEPTVGIDVGAKVEVYEFMKDLAEKGAAILLVSSELPEVLHLSNRLYVMHRGRLVAELTGDAITEERVLASFFEEQDKRGSGHGVAA
ncbi:MAG: sugar ABC transporter ATP-binding protein [Geminicoccaceae bacterium]